MKTMQTVSKWDLLSELPNYAYLYKIANLVIAINLLSVADGLLTIMLYTAGFIEEFNPLLRIFINYPLMFMFIKTCMVLIGSVFLARNKARRTLKTLAVIYSLVVFYHGILIWRTLVF